LIEGHGCKLEFLPPYSPDYNPIELSFAIIKQALKREKTLTGDETLEELADKVISLATRVVTREISTNQFRHCKLYVS